LGKIAPFDISDVCGMNLWDIKASQWHEKLLALAAGRFGAEDLKKNSDKYQRMAASTSVRYPTTMFRDMASTLLALWLYLLATTHPPSLLFPFDLWTQWSPWALLPHF
jgi:hypothetical protein